MKNELHAIISGEGKVEHGKIIQAVASYLARGQGTSGVVEEYKHFKRQENKRLSTFADENGLWVKSINLENFVSQGAEQKVYLKDGKTVVKLNDAIYYHSWVDYFHNLLLNNFFFPDTAYKLIGFYMHEDAIYAVVEQPFVKATEHTDLESVRMFMQQNGFVNTRNNDYYNSKLGIILEDLHDENVLSENGLLRFIDTVFYIKSQ